MCDPGIDFPLSPAGFSLPLGSCGSYHFLRPISFFLDVQEDDSIHDLALLSPVGFFLLFFFLTNAGEKVFACSPSIMFMVYKDFLEFK